MKKIYVFTLLMFLINALYSQSLEWAQSYGGSNDDKGMEVITDRYGNIYIAGTFSSPSITISSYNFQNKGSSDAFIAKMNNAGQVLWAVHLGSAGEERIITLQTDSLMNVYAAFDFSGTLTIGTTNISNNGNSDIAVVKFDSIGKFIWGKSFGNSNEEKVYDIILDEMTNIYISGRFLSSTLMFDHIKLTRQGGADGFIVKLNSSGQAQWAQSFGNLRDDRIITLSIADNHLYFGGIMRSPQLNFGNITIYNSHSHDNSDIIIGKFDLNGTIKWASSYGGNDHDWIFAVETDEEGNLYIGGEFPSDSINLGLNTLINNGYIDAFLAKYEKDGTPLWTKSYGGDKHDRVHALVFNKDNIYVTGYIESSSVNTELGILNTNGGGDAYFFKLKKSGHLLSYDNIGGDKYEIGLKIAHNNSDGIYIIGKYTSDSLIVESSKLYNNGSGSGDIFLIKYKESPVYTLAGQVFANQFPIDFGRAYLYFSDHEILLDSMEIDTLGYYDFYQVSKGDYKVMVKLLETSKDYGNYDLTYYGDKAEWNNAAVINLTKNIYDADINLIAVVSVDDGLKIRLLVSPNPFCNYLNINIEDKAIQIINIYNASGQLLISESYPNSNISSINLNVTDLKRGAYILEVIDNDKSQYLSKLIK